MLSAGILAYRKGARGLEVLLVHPGGPFWRKKEGQRRLVYSEGRN